MKKPTLFLNLIIFLGFIFILTACTAEAVVQSETDFAVNEIYLAAKELGFDGTLEEFLEFVRGSDGRGIENIYINDDGVLTIVLTDETVYTLGNVKGSDGKDGDDGTGIISARIDENGFLLLTFSDGSVVNCGDVTGENGTDGAQGEQGVQGEKGEDGLDGRGIDKLFITSDGMLVAVFTDSDDEVIIGRVSGENGAQGKPGNGIDSVTVSEEGNLIITLEDGSHFDCGNIRGEDGKDGEQGIQGEKGEQGEQGIQGEKGEQGEQGIQGEKGEQGEQGIQGEKGEQGEQGIQGEKGENGLSAYEIYLKYHPEYTGSESQWIEDLVNGNLSSDGSGEPDERPEETDRYTVYIYCGDREYIQSVEKGQTADFGVVDKDIPGYEFLYWECNTEIFAENTLIYGDTTVVAVYKELKPDYIEITDLWETTTIEANQRYRIIMSDTYAYSLQAVTFYSDSGTTELELLFGDRTEDFFTFECAGQYVEYSLAEYKHSGGYVLDIWFKGDPGDILSVIPIF